MVGALQGVAMSSAADPLLLTAARVLTFDGPKGLTHASGFFFRRVALTFLLGGALLFDQRPLPQTAKQ